MTTAAAVLCLVALFVSSCAVAFAAGVFCTVRCVAQAADQFFLPPRHPRDSSTFGQSHSRSAATGRGPASLEES